VDLAACDLTSAFADDSNQRHFAQLCDGIASSESEALKDRNLQVRNALILAHWEAQSYMREQYTDLKMTFLRTVYGTTVRRVSASACEAVMDGFVVPKIRAGLLS